jgi:hypothetical protein
MVARFKLVDILTRRLVHIRQLREDCVTGGAFAHANIVGDARTLSIEQLQQRSERRRHAGYQGADKDSLAFQMTRENSHTPSDRRE